MAALALALLVVCFGSDPARLAGGRFFSDGATYYAMTWSLVSDFDVEYTAADLTRVKREYPAGPSGIFLKRASGGFEFAAAAPWLRPVSSHAKRIYFGKAMTYPVLAAPFVAALGSRGFLVFNALALLVAWACAFIEIRRRASEAMAALASAVLILATVAPLYVFWIQPEVFNLALVSIALLAWRMDQPLLSAVLFGVAGYTKPTHLLMAAPLGLSPLFDASRSIQGRAVETLRRGLLMTAVAAALFGVNMLVTGEWNYQGGERKTFSSQFPFDRGADKDITFGNSGEWMTTMKLGPLEQGEKETRGAGIAQSAAELDSMFRANLIDFWLGRYGGLLPYFAPGFLAMLVFMLIGPRDRAGWMALAGIVIFCLVSIRILPGPTNWYGGGGTVGNRYFMAALPLTVFLIPRGRELLVALAGFGVSALFLAPAWIDPVPHSLNPSLLASRPFTPITFLRAELAMLNDLSFCTDGWRKKQPYDDVEGDPPLHRPGAQHGYWLYFPDDGTFGRERIPGMTFADGEPVEGFRVRRGSRTETLLRANEPVDWIDVTLFAMTAGDEVTLSAGGTTERRVTPPRGSISFRLVPGPYVIYYDSFVYAVTVRSHAPSTTPNPASAREQNTLVRLALHVSPRPR